MSVRGSRLFGRQFGFLQGVQNWLDRHISLSGKLTLALLLILFFGLGVGNWVLRDRMRANIEQTTMEAMHLLANEAQNDMLYWMSRNNLDELKRRLEQLSKIPAINRVILYSADGQPYCYFSERSVESPLPADLLRKFQATTRAHWSQEGDRLVFYQPFRADGQCVDCHSEWRPGQLAAVLGIDFRSHFGQQYSSVQRVLWVNFVLTAIFILGFSGLFIHEMVSKRIRPTVKAAQALARGEWEAADSLHVGAHDEIGILNGAFQKMAEEVKRAFREIQEAKEKAETAQRVAEEAREEARKQKVLLEEEISRLTRMTNAIQGGDLSVKMQASDYQQIPNLVMHINQIVQDLRMMIGQIQFSANELSESAGEIFSAMEQFSEGVKGQEANTAQVAVAVEEMTKNILETSRNAHAMRDYAKEVGQLIRDGTERMIHTTESMQQIVLVNNQVDDTLKKLIDQASGIRNILELIDEIADQTNLLALNAAIEAARAGDQGRGFAVVADEVRKLAERTSSATKEIAQMVRSIEQDTRVALETMELSRESIERGRKEVEEMNGLLQKIQSKNTRLDEMIGQITVAAEELGAAAEQISQNMTHITEVARSFLPMSEQLTNTAGELYQLTESLRNMVSKFQISGEFLEKEAVVGGGNGHGNGQKPATNLPRGLFSRNGGKTDPKSS